jgi:polysaccharide deacetylase 2 family uncharacterized protein YibQ
LKKKNRRYLHIAFWTVIVLGGLWVAFAPTPKPHHHVAQKVEVAPLPEEKPEPPPVAPAGPVGDEQAQPALPPNEVIASPPEKSPPGPKGSAKIAIVIDDVGLDISGSRRAVALPAYITLSYMPYATRLKEQTREAQALGHELMLHMPMEPMGSADPGPGALLVDLPQEEVRRRLDMALASFTGFDGMNNHMGSKFTADAAGMEIVIDELQQRHLFYLDSRTSAQSVGYKIAREHGLPTISRDVFLDDDMSPKAVRAQLEATERVARHKGYAVAIGHPHAATLQALEEWLPDATQRGFVFVPIKELVNRTSP